MPVSKHTQAVFLDNQPFIVRSYNRSVTDDLVSRFGSAESGQTNLDLLKALTQKGYRGGMFQREYDDPEKASTISNAYYNAVDGKLYPTPAWAQTSSTNDMDGYGVRSWCYYKDNIYIAFKNANPTTGLNKIYRVNPTTGVFTVLTLPSSLQNAGDIRLSEWGDWLVIAVSASGSYAHTYDGTTFTASTEAFRAFMTFNSKLYGLNSAYGLREITAVTAGSFAFSGILATIGGRSHGPNFADFKDSIEYNNALYFGMRTGLYRYDGTSIRAVLDYSKSIDYNNFSNFAIFNGRMYYTMGDTKLFQFDGVNIEELIDTKGAYTIRSLAAGGDRLWIATLYDTGVTYSDKYQSGVATVYRMSMICYNGIGFFEYRAFTDDILAGYGHMKPIPINGRVITFIPDIYLNFSMEVRSNGFKEYMLTLADEFTTTNAGDGFVVTSSEIDCSYPSVTKVLNGLLTTSGGITSGEAVLTVEAQYLVDNTWSSWSEIWNTANVVSGGITNDYLLHDRSTAGTPALATTPQVFSKIRLRTTLDITDTTPTTLPYLADQTIRYTIQPRLRMKWLLDLDLNGKDTRDLTTPTLSDGTREDRSASYLRKIIYDAYRNKKPILFYDIDWTEVKTVTPLAVKGVDFLTAGDYMAVQDAIGDADAWINARIDSVTYDELDNETAVTLASTGARVGIGGSANTALQADAQVRRSHAVYIRQIRNERVIVDANVLNTRGTDHTDIGSTITLDLVEV